MVLRNGIIGDGQRGQLDTARCDIEEVRLDYEWFDVEKWEKGRAAERKRKSDGEPGQRINDLPEANRRKIRLVIDFSNSYS